jgi:hypothetical protein
MTKIILPYTFEVNEEIARWTLEIFLYEHGDLGWWIAFTNPTAGPWKTISSINTDGKLEEIYRFTREENRPDLVLVNDELKIIVIMEAKEEVSSLLKNDQMIKSVEVIENMKKILSSLINKSWLKRRSYKIIPGFLWYAGEREKAIPESKSVDNFFNQHNSNELDHPLNVAILKEDDRLLPIFMFRGKSSETPVLE